MQPTGLQRALATIVGWGTALLLFFPIAWMVLTSFKSEADAISPQGFFSPTLESYREVFARAHRGAREDDALTAGRISPAEACAGPGVRAGRGLRSGSTAVRRRS